MTHGIRKTNIYNIERQKMAFKIYCAMVSSIRDYADLFTPVRNSNNVLNWTDMAEQAYELADAFITVTGAIEFCEKSIKNNG